eukprot:gb/GFBE01027161.1/.p1 GENE.gb/GFBE01027161.1/~~gb/GFBE01027161.1/.p1  ORF type:complete len:341 (+),score=87.83 gb/GFBE01027161.1/:1-1023(+)
MVYTGNEFQDLPAKQPAASLLLLKVGLFAFFVVIRAVHPTIIDASKTLTDDGARIYAYGAQTVNMAEVVFSWVFAQVIALQVGGVAQWRLIWRPRPLLIFSGCGILFGLGDYLEMQSMVSLGGSAYQILLQSRLLITALLSWTIKGTRQTALQWNLLALVMLSMCVYMCMGSNSAGNSSQLLLGAFNTLLKVVVSCLASVLTDKYTKEFSDEPVHVQAVQLRCGRFISLLMLILMDGQTLEKGFFHGWDACVCGVLLSFMLKAWSTLYLLSYLDSILKNIGEALAVLVTYIMEVCLPYFATNFEVSSLLAVMVVILAVLAYVNSKSVIEKANKYDERCAC